MSHLTIHSSETFILAIFLLVIQIANTHTFYVLDIALGALHI